MSQTVWTKKGPIEMSTRNIILKRRVEGTVLVIGPVLGGRDSAIALLRSLEYERQQWNRKFNAMLSRLRRGELGEQRLPGNTPPAPRVISPDSHAKGQLPARLESK